MKDVARKHSESSHGGVLAEKMGVGAAKSLNGVCPSTERAVMSFVGFGGRNMKYGDHG